MKTHLKDSDDPLVSGQDYTALCETLVKKAHFVCYFDMGRLAIFPVSTLKFCQDCAELVGDANKKYLYGIVDGESLKHQEIEA